jgi:hypothetical protein
VQVEGVQGSAGGRGQSRGRVWGLVIDACSRAIAPLSPGLSGTVPFRRLAAPAPGHNYARRPITARCVRCRVASPPSPVLRLRGEGFFAPATAFPPQGRHISKWSRHRGLTWRAPEAFLPDSRRRRHRRRRRRRRRRLRRPRASIARSPVAVPQLRGSKHAPADFDRQGQGAADSASTATLRRLLLPDNGIARRQTLNMEVMAPMARFAVTLITCSSSCAPKGA